MESPERVGYHPDGTPDFEAAVEHFADQADYELMEGVEVTIADEASSRRSVKSTLKKVGATGLAIAALGGGIEVGAHNADNEHHAEQAKIAHINQERAREGLPPLAGSAQAKQTHQTSPEK